MIVLRSARLPSNKSIDQDVNPVMATKMNSTEKIKTCIFFLKSFLARTFFIPFPVLIDMINH